MKPIITLIITLFIVTGVKGQTKRISFADYDKKVSDTAHFWLKDISSGMDYTRILLPRIDTVHCFILVAPEQYHLEPKWCRVYAIRDKEKVFDYCNQYGISVAFTGTILQTIFK